MFYSKNAQVQFYGGFKERQYPHEKFKLKIYVMKSRYDK